MKPLRQGELDSLCGLYAVVNALRLCSATKLNGAALQAVFRNMLREMSDDLPRLSCSGSTDDDVKRYLRVAFHMLREKYSVDLTFRYREFSSYAKLEIAAAAHLAEPNSAMIISVDRHLTVVSAVHGCLWELHDSWGYKYLHCQDGKVTRQKPMLRALPELGVFIIGHKRIS